MAQKRGFAPATELSVGQVARRSGVSVSALHFYEKKGLISSRRSVGNQRRFARDILRLVAVIRIAQRAGVTLSEIAEVLGALPNGRAPDAKDWPAIWRDTIQLRIDHLTKLRDELNGCIGCGCLSLKACPLRNPGDIMAGINT